ncbi:MAG: hypothetical protein JF588_08745 [Caulobacterales bacterium]|nr:hypothetical protein [Caulobacterales bacterium]
MTPERLARAERMRGYFALQLALARRMSELTGAPLGAAAARYTNFHRRFGLGRLAAAPAPAWAAYAEALEAAPDPDAQVEVTYRAFLGMPEEGGHETGRRAFGCFACEPPTADGSVSIHFLNLDTDEAGGPLTGGKLAQRRAEIAAMVRSLRDEHPVARHIRGKSWLYNLEAYRRVFPPDYAASARPTDGPVHLHGNSLWGQTIDSWERPKPQIAEAVLAALPGLDPAAPWRAFPLPVMTTVAPIESFKAFYGL